MAGQEDSVSVYYSESDSYESDDSQQDPTFDISHFSDLSISRESRTRKMDGFRGVLDVGKATEPQLHDTEEKEYGNVQDIVNAGLLDTLKVDQCKAYLRKHRLRLTGNKEILINRIKEHLEILNGGGEGRYPASSFVMDCKGDACEGDAVMFEQNVYEMFNIASRSATSCGKRVVAGRIVKESYGASKQQHTFTIEVLWSKGEKPLPPLHPLLIKGRNLYRLKTLRQRWEDEGERQKILSEKHARGSVARLNREARLQEKGKYQKIKTKRLSGTEGQNRGQEEHIEEVALQRKVTVSEKAGSQSQRLNKESENNTRQAFQQERIGGALQPKGTVFERAGSQTQRLNKESENNTRSPFQTMPVTSGKMGSSQLLPGQKRDIWDTRNELKFLKEQKVMSESLHDRPNYSLYSNVQADQRQLGSWMNQLNIPTRKYYENVYSSGPSFCRYVHDQTTNFRATPEKQLCEIGSRNYHNLSRNLHGYHEGTKIANIDRRDRIGHEGLVRTFEQKQLCQYFAQGRCYYGENCQYLHEFTKKRNYAQRPSRY